MAGGPAPGLLTHPDRVLDYRPEPERVRVTFNGEVIADSRAAIALREADYPVVHYLPAGDVRAGLLVRSRHSSYCPFKGTASYWSIRVGDRVSQDAAWAYETPYDEAGLIEGHVAFYLSRVDRIEVG